jgi:hypothetical protein
MGAAEEAVAVAVEVEAATAAAALVGAAEAMPP